MGRILLFVIILMELSLTVCSITKKSSLKKLRLVVRISTLLLFVMLCASPIIEFSLKWYTLGGLLSLISLLSFIFFVRKREVMKSFNVTKEVFGLLGRCFLFFIALVPPMIFPDYNLPETTGEYKVATDTFTYTDYSRKDENGENEYVNVAFWYPENGESRYPLVIFDHGAFGIKESNYSVYLELASHGYVVCSIDHPGHSFYTVSEDGITTIVDMEYMNEVTNSNTATCTSEEYMELISKWMKVRVEDMNLTIDTILNHVDNNNSELPYRLVDKEKIGLFGHSMGAATSVWVGGARSDIDAVINIDGPYFSEIYYDSSTSLLRAKGTPYHTPILNIYSDQVWVQLQDGTDTDVYAANKISNYICEESFDLYLKGAKHLTLTDLVLHSPFLTDMLNGEKAIIDIEYCMRIEREAILEFFDCYLKSGPVFTKEGTFSVE